MITNKEIEAAQKKWARSIIRIGNLKKNSAGLLIAANYMLDELYAFQEGSILFKPSKIVSSPFRTDREGVLSYYIGGNPKFPEDDGFALRPWKKVHFKNAAIQTSGNIAMVMGHYYFEDEEHKTITAEFSFGYIKDDQGSIRINLQHSSLPANAVAPKIERRSTKLDMLHGTTDYRISYA